MQSGYNFKVSKIKMLAYAFIGNSRIIDKK